VTFGFWAFSWYLNRETLLYAAIWLFITLCNIIKVKKHGFSVKFLI
jgi:hypothetical protein